MFLINNFAKKFIYEKGECRTFPFNLIVYFKMKCSDRMIYRLISRFLRTGIIPNSEDWWECANSLSYAVGLYLFLCDNNSRISRSSGIKTFALSGS